jgi:diguanylate cyclase (GGDEF)-like protein
MQDVGKVWRSFWKGPDAATLVAGGEGERQVAYVRVVVVALLLITPSYRLIENPSSAENLWGFNVAVLAMIFALSVFFYLRHGSYRPALGFLTASVDASLVTLALTLFVIVGSPLDGVNDRVTFEVYFLVIMAMSLRQDRRICLLVGSFLVLQYGALVIYVADHYDLKALFKAYPYAGGYSSADEWTRIILLSSAAFISYAYVARSQTLVNRAIRDPLTGLLNRGYFDTLFAYEMDKARRYKHRFAVILVDADHFKVINDTYGHTAGDMVLKMLARALQAGVRDSDIVVRYGGEEFVLLLHETGPQDAYAKAEALRQMVERLEVTSAAVIPVRFTMSAGVAIYPDDGSAPHILLSCADRRLLDAKQAGRNKVVAL